MKKNVFLLLIGVVLVYIGVAIGKTSNNEDIIKDDTEASVIKHENSLSMMLETEANSGNYEMTTRSEWPTEGYVFNTELSKCENGGELSWDNEKKVVLMSGNVSDKCYVYFDVYVAPTLADYVISQYNGVQGNNHIYYHDANLTNGAGDNSYRYAGANPNNFVCFGNDKTQCPENNLYRMIGVIDNKVKLVKSIFATKEEFGTDGAYNKTVDGIDYYSFYYLNGNMELIDTNLNVNFKNYIENINSKWIDYINSEKFKYINDGMEYWYSYNKNVVKKIEQFSTISYLFGIMQASDYVFSASSNYWAENVTSNNSDSYLNISKSNEYLFGFLTDGLSTYMPLERLDKAINMDESVSGPEEIFLPTRPAFYLNSGVTYKSGSGTKNDPIILGD